jgi:hypothetical protein
MNSLAITNQDILKPGEEKILVQILEILHAGEEKSEKKEDLIKKLSAYPVRLLYILSEISPEINQLLESNAYLNEKWSDKLKSLKYPYLAIVSFDRTTIISPFSQLKGAFLLSKLGDNPDFNHPDSFVILNQACEIGMYHALVQRLNFHSELIEQKQGSKSNQEEIENHIQVILHDAHKLSNIYWAIGCIDAAIILFNIVNYYFDIPANKFSIDRFFAPAERNQFSWIRQYDNTHCPVPLTILKAAVENIYIAHLLSDYPPSKQISDQITQGRGLLVELDKSFSSPEGLMGFVKDKLNNLSIPLVESFCRNAYKHSISQIYQFYPDIELPEELDSHRNKNSKG